MELRLLTSSADRHAFAECLAKARASRGARWAETPQSQLGNAHVGLCSPYALYESETDPLDRMLGGFIIHDLATLPQTLPQPHLSHLHPRSIIEGSDLWSLSSGVFRIVQGAVAAVAALLQARAILVYPMAKPVDLSSMYEPVGFTKPCGHLLWPYAKALDGTEIWMQPMVLEGEPLETFERSGFDFLFGRGRDRRALRFDKPVEQPPARSSDEHRNGSAAA